MKKKKLLIVIISILIILTIIISIILSNMKKKQERIEEVKSENPTLSTTLDLKKVSSEAEFFTVQECINKYFEAVNNKEGEIVYNLLNSEYKNKENLTNSNVLQNTYQLKNGFEKFMVKKAYNREITYDQEYQYYIYGELLGNNYETIQTIYMIVNLDFTNMTFAISFPKKVEVSNDEYLEVIDDLLNNNTNEFINVSGDSKQGIKSNSYNNFTMSINEPKQALNYYLDNYVIMAVYYPEIAYNLLDTEYREKRFEDLESYKKYVSDNENQLLNFTINEYNISEKDEYTQYTIIDTFENYYIFKVNDIMDYTLILDIYTVDLEEIASKYDGFSVQEKVSINIQKIIAALNDKNYKYIYSKLDDNFKNNNYKTLQEFEDYMSGRFFGKLEVSFKDFVNEGETYIYNITLNGTTASNNNEINMQIIMQLKDNRDFVMSFSIK